MAMPGMDMGTPALDSMEGMDMGAPESGSMDHSSHGG
jgi:hypothetical protein